MIVSFVWKSYKLVYQLLLIASTCNKDYPYLLLIIHNIKEEFLSKTIKIIYYGKDKNMFRNFFFK